MATPAAPHHRGGAASVAIAASERPGDVPQQQQQDGSGAAEKTEEEESKDDEKWETLMPERVKAETEVGSKIAAMLCLHRPGCTLCSPHLNGCNTNPPAAAAVSPFVIRLLRSPTAAPPMPFDPSATITTTCRGPTHPTAAAPTRLVV